MKKICFLILILGGFILPLSAAHIRGGELYYKYVGPGAGANTSTYLVTLKAIYRLRTKRSGAAGH